jgi:hypothetical protein
MKARKGPLLALLSALMAATSASSASAWENPLENPYLDEPLEVCDQGSFFVGGVPKVTKYAAGPTAGDPQQITIGQAYVQFQVPKTRRRLPAEGLSLVATGRGRFVGTAVPRFG